MRFLLCSAVALMLASACSNQPEKTIENLDPAQKTLAAALDFHFEHGFDSIEVGFRMRGRDYKVKRQGGNFTYVRSYSDSVGTYVGTLTNIGFTEIWNGSPTALSPKDSTGRASSINSVVYFSLLPLFLADPAVKSCCLAEESIDGKRYQRFEISFAEDGGGNDHDDVYLYWVDPLDGSIDFFAYSFEVNEGGTRFRKAINSRRVNGIYFQDYVNFKGPADPDSLSSITKLYSENRLDTLSVVVIDNISVSYSKP